MGWLIIRSLTTSYYHRYLIDGTSIEIIWTIIPAVILIFIAFPSLKLLYLMDEVIDPALTIKAIGQPMVLVPMSILIMVQIL